MKHLIKITLSIFLFLFCINLTYAKKLPRFSQKMYDSLIVDSSLVVCNDLLTIGNPPSDTLWRNGYSINRSKGFVILGFKRNDGMCIPSPMTFSIQLQIKYWNQNAILNTIDTILSVFYNNNNGNSYKEQAVYVLDSACYIDVKITSISNDSFQKYFYLENQIEEDRFYTNFNPSYTPTYNINYYSSTDEIEITITDSLLNKMEEYDLEYTFVSGYTRSSLSSILASSQAGYNFKNGSTRVILKAGSYRITNIFDKGYLIIRLRAVAYGGSGFQHRINGNWSLPESGFCNTYSSSVVTINTGSTVLTHAPTLGWQLVTEFAEDIRKNEVITYYDGSLRNRQTVTRNFTDSTAIVGEIIYDFEGRPAINVLPAPSFENKIKYYPNFNLNSNGVKYSFVDFEQDNICEATTDSMKVTSGASKYYSTNNPLTNFNTSTNANLPNKMDFVAVAFGFPFSQTVFLNDNSGRVKRQGGVGINHQIGSGHESFYYYGIPFQEELDRLFGTEVGNFNHYKKNMVIDPNGQVSVNYLNASGKTIATALAATSPENVSTLSSNSARNGVKVNLKSNGDTLVSSESVTISRSFTVDEDGKEHKLFYSLVPEKYFPSCNPRDVCYDCIYDLEINLINDDCGNIVIKGGGDTLKVLKRTISNSGADTICAESQYYSFNADERLEKGSTENPTDTFVIVTLPRGSYTLTKILTVNQDAYNIYLDDFLSNRVCKTKEEFIQEAIDAMDTLGCNYDCQACESSLGTESSFLSNRIIELLSYRDTVTAFDTTNILDQYAANLESCAKLCLDENPSVCEGILDVLKMDISPGGQYAQFIYNETLEVYQASATSHNILLEGSAIIYFYKEDTFFVNRSAMIDGVSVSYSDMTVSEFIRNWKSEFADHLVYLHPEYCKYEDCLLNENSNWFDERMRRIETYEIAYDSSMLNPINTSISNSFDPYFATGGQGVSAWSTIQSTMNNYTSVLSNDTPYAYSMWEIPISMLFCGQSVNEYDRRNCVTQYTDTVLNCEIYKNAAWQYFKSLYYASKHHIQDSIAKLTGCNESGIPTGYTIRFPYVSDSDVNTPGEAETMKSGIVNQVIDTCYTICESYRDSWREKLRNCIASEVEMELILDSMVSVCQLGCDFNNPFGASTVTPTNFDASSVQYKSFNDVLKTLLRNPDNSVKSIYVPQICDAFSISMPQDFGHNYFGNLNPNADTCACTQKYYNQPLFRSTRACPDTVNTPNNNCPCTNAGVNPQGAKILIALQDHEEQYKCKTCVSCEGFRNAFQTYYNEYDTFNIDIPTNQEFLTKFLNRVLKFNLNFKDYISFAASCSGFTSGDLDSVFEINADTVFQSFSSIYMVYKGNTLLSFEPMNNPSFIPVFAEPWKANTVKTQFAKESIKLKGKPTILLELNNSNLPNLNWFETYSKKTNNMPQEWLTASTEVSLPPSEENSLPPIPIIHSSKRAVYQPTRILKIQKMMDGPPPPVITGLDTCGCDKILSAQKLFMAGGSGASSASELFSNFYYGKEILPNFDSLQVICCRAANGDKSTINWNTVFAEPCTLPNNWKPGGWSKKNNDSPTITLDSVLKRVTTDNPNLKLPNIFKCVNPCMTKVDTCACSKIVANYAKFQSDSANGLTSKTFGQYFSDSVAGPEMTNIYKILLACNDAKTEGNGVNWQAILSLANLNAFFDQDSMALVPKMISCLEENNCNPSDEDTFDIVEGDTIFYKKGTSNLVDCSMILNILNATKYATGLVGNPWEFTSNAIYRDSVLIRLNNAFNIPPYNRIFDYDALYLAMRGECWCEFYPTKEECRRVGPKPCLEPGCRDSLPSGGRVIGDTLISVNPISFQDTCGTCYSPTSLLGLLQQFLDTLTHNSITLSTGCPINKLCRNNWDIYPNYPRYYNTELYSGNHATALKYTLSEFEPSRRMKLTLNDQNGNVRDITLNFSKYDVKNNFQYIRKIFDIRALPNFGCDTNILNFIVRAVMQRGGNYIPPTYDTLLLMGSVGNPWRLAKPTNCNLLCLKLCNKPLAPASEIKFSFDPCLERLRIEANKNAEVAWERYKDSVSGSFKHAYYTKCLGARKNEVFEMRYNERQYHYTLYYYDQSGNLIKTVPPAGVQPLSTVQTDSIKEIRKARLSTTIVPAHTLVTHYRYNTLNQISWQKTPDGGIILFYYDALGRLAISQNAKQKVGNYYSYTIYDELGRICEVGELRNTTTTNQDYLRSNTNMETFLSGTFRRQITKTVYDNSDFIIVGKFEPENLRNRVSGSTYSENNSENYDQAVYYSYDIHGNVKTILRENPSLVELEQDFKIITYDYDLASGKVNGVSFQTDEIDEYQHSYEYDNDMRLKRVYSGPGQYVKEIDAVYSYYMHGPLARTELGSLQVQGLDYAYTIQGWMKGINSSATHQNRDIGKDGNQGNNLNPHRTFAADIFGFTLSYFEQDYNSTGILSSTQNFEASTIGSSLSSNAPSLFNGNIRHMSVSIKAFGNTPISYAYKYDQLNRIKEMNAYATYDSTNNNWQSSGSPLTAYKNTFTYDQNGNILSQLRNGKADTTDLDDLTYQYYSGSNKLKRVLDNVNLSNYADDVDNQADSNYLYDPIGNLIRDKAEEIDTILWNVYGKISKIKRTPESSKPDLEFYYTPDGHRSIKVVIPKTEGAFKTYSYYVRDAQGNIMAVYTRDFDKVIYYDSLKYNQVNDSLIISAGQTGFADFIGNLHGSTIIDESLSDYLKLRLDSSVDMTKEFLYENDPTNMLNSNLTMLSNAIGSYSNNAFLNAINGAGYTHMENLFGNICNCLTTRNTMTGGPPLVLFDWLTSDYAQAQSTLWALYYYNSSDMINILGGMGHSYVDMATAETFISTCTLADFRTQMDLFGYEDCGILKSILYSLLQNDATKLIDLLSLHPDIKEMVGGTIYSGYCTTLSTSEVITSLVTYDRTTLWDMLMVTESLSSMVEYFKDNYPIAYYYTMANKHPEWISDYQRNHNLYAFSGTGMESYFGNVKEHFGQVFYDNLIAQFLNASKTYMDSFRLAEHHIYGSSRIGVYQNYVPIVGRYFNANVSENQLNDQENIDVITEQKSYSLFALYRGKKRYELSNHLGNVLTVISDKRIITCGADTVYYYSADVISATDYSPFGAPLPGRTYQASQYRFAFNGQEKDVETYGDGNAYDFGARIYDTRTGRWLSCDPLGSNYPFLSPYNFVANSPLLYIDPDGRKIIISGSQEFVTKTFTQLQSITSVQLVLLSNGVVKEANKLNEWESHMVVQMGLVVEPKNYVETVKKPFGTLLVAKAIETSKSISILETDNSYHDENETIYDDPENSYIPGVGSNSTIYHDPTDNGTKSSPHIKNQDGTEGRSPIIGVGHELIHALKGALGKRLKGQSMFGDPDNLKENGKTYQLSNEEVDTRAKENLVSEEQGETIRAKPLPGKPD